MIGRVFHGGLALLRTYASVLLLAIGGLLLYFFVSIEFWSIVGPVLGVVVGSFIAILGTLVGRFRDTEPPTDAADPEPLDARIPLLLASLYVLSMVVLFRFSTYYRPDLMYVLFGGYAGVIGYQIARGESRVRIVPQILVLAFFAYWSSQFLFPAGMFGPDTHHGYVPAIETTFSTFQIPSQLARYAGHLAYVIEFSYLSGLSAEVSYYLLATLVLTGTVLLLGMADRILPAVPERVALYSALVFSIMSWMIGRGMHPNKLNFFYPMILLLGFVAVKLYQAQTVQFTKVGWVVVGLILSPALIFGHRFSAGAGLIFLLVIGAFAVLSHTALRSAYPDVPAGSPMAFISIYTIGVLGNPLHQGALLNRLSGLFLSVLVSTGAVEPSGSGGVAGGGPGRYSALPLDVLFVSTAAQLILFTFMTLGAIWVFRESEWEYDFVLLWMGTISAFLVVTIVTNSVDTAPQRFYALLGLFGFNVCAGVFFHLVSRYGHSLGETGRSVGRVVVVVLICGLAVTSLASPVADKATSPVADDVPHAIQFETRQSNEGQSWMAAYSEREIYRIAPLETNVPTERTGRATGAANLTGLNDTAMYSYSTLADRTGVVISSGLTLGGRNFAFVESPANATDDKLYTNGQTFVYEKERRPNRERTR